MAKEFEKKQLVKKSEDSAAWYTDVILKSGLADYAPVKGCMVIKPYGYAIWEEIQKVLDKKLKDGGVKNAYFPLFIPEKLLNKEKEHIKGFSPELAIVTIGGGKELEERLVVRPTSETIIYDMFSKWIKSWRDLPLLINQWCNVVRWEMRTRLFARTTEFLWQEAHTCHETHEQSIQEVKWGLSNYVSLYRDFFGIDGIYGKKSESEKFPGAEATYTYEILMTDGKALQAGTSHDLGQNFAKVFGIKFLDREGKEKLPWQTCFGFSTRSMAALIMVHGDDSGLVLPPKLAPIQVVIVPVLPKKTGDESLEAFAMEIKEKLNDFRVEIDMRKEYSIGWKFNDWELKGVPLRIEIGKKELEQKTVTLVRRDNFQKIVTPADTLKQTVSDALSDIQKKLFEKSRDYLQSNTKEIFDYKEFKDIMKKSKGFLKVFWCEDPVCEKKIKEETQATTRVLPEGALDENGTCIYCGKEAKRKWIFAKSY